MLDKAKGKENKEMLSNLLKKILDIRLTKLEKKNLEEIKAIKSISKDSQIIITNLDEYSQNVRKHILIGRQTKMKRPMLEIKKKKSVNSARSISKEKAKSVYSKPLTRMASKSLTNIRKLNNYNYNPQADNVSKYSEFRKSTKKTGSCKNLNTSKISSRTTVYDKSPNSIFKKENFTVKQRRAMTPKRRTKDKNRLTTKIEPDHGRKQSIINLDNIDDLNRTSRKKNKNYSQFLNKGKKTDQKDDKDRSIISSISKITCTTTKSDNKAKTFSGKFSLLLSKNEGNKKEDERLQTLNVYENNNKKTEERIPKNIAGATNIINKVSTIHMDEELINDELLLDNNFNIDNLYEDIISSKIDDDIMNSKIINDKQNGQYNDKKVKEKEKVYSKLVDNIKKIKKSKIRMSLINIDNDMNLLEADLRISSALVNNSLNENESDQIPLQEKFETNLDVISGYLNNIDNFKLMLVNKECFKTLVNMFISKIEITINFLEDEIKKIKESNHDILFEKVKIKPFTFNLNSKRVLSLLNTSSANNFVELTLDQLNNREIEIIYDIYFIAIGKKNEIVNFPNPNKKLEYIKKYFSYYISKRKLGSFIESEIKGKTFNDEIINSLYKISSKYNNIISPNYYQKIDKNIAIFVFIVKDILEYIGLLTSRNITPEKEFIIINARLQTCKKTLSELNKIYKIVD